MTSLSAASRHRFGGYGVLSSSSASCASSGGIHLSCPNTPPRRHQYHQFVTVAAIEMRSQQQQRQRYIANYDSGIGIGWCKCYYHVSGCINSRYYNTNNNIPNTPTNHQNSPGNQVSEPQQQDGIRHYKSALLELETMRQNATQMGKGKESNGNWNGGGQQYGNQLEHDDNDTEASSARNHRRSSHQQLHPLLSQHREIIRQHLQELISLHNERKLLGDTNKKSSSSSSSTTPTTTTSIASICNSLPSSLRRQISRGQLYSLVSQELNKLHRRDHVTLKHREMVRGYVASMKEMDDSTAATTSHRDAPNPVAKICDEIMELKSFASIWNANRRLLYDLVYEEWKRRNHHASVRPHHRIMVRQFLERNIQQMDRSTMNLQQVASGILQEGNVDLPLYLLTPLVQKEWEKIQRKQIQTQHATLIHTTLLNILEKQQQEEEEPFQPNQDVSTDTLSQACDQLQQLPELQYFYRGILYDIARKQLKKLERHATPNRLRTHIRKLVEEYVQRDGIEACNSANLYHRIVPPLSTQFKHLPSRSILIELISRAIEHEQMRIFSNSENEVRAVRGAIQEFLEGVAELRHSTLKQLVQQFEKQQHDMLDNLKQQQNVVLSHSILQELLQKELLKLERRRISSDERRHIKQVTLQLHKTGKKPKEICHELRDIITSISDMSLYRFVYEQIVRIRKQRR